MTKRFWYQLLIWLSGIGALALSLVAINSLGCNYEMKISNGESDYYAVCRFGKLTVLERDRHTKAIWRVSAYQAVIGDQLIYWVTDRTAIQHAVKPSNLEDYNQVQNSLSIPLNYGWKMITPTHIAIFQHSPHPEISQGHFEGWLDFYHRIWPDTPVHPQ